LLEYGIAALFVRQRESVRVDSIEKNSTDRSSSLSSFPVGQRRGGNSQALLKTSTS
jgi:hypothetical protein